MAELTMKQICVKTFKTGEVIEKVSGHRVDVEDTEIFGLSEAGKVFRYIWKKEGWFPLSMKRIDA